MSLMYTKLERAPVSDRPVFRRFVVFANPLIRVCFNRMFPGAEDDVLHNHAATFLSVIFWGGYTEEIWDGVERQDALRWFRRLADCRPPDRILRRRMLSVRFVRLCEVHHIRDVKPHTTTLMLSIGRPHGTTEFGVIAADD